MKLAVQIIGVLIACAGLFLLITPEYLYGLVERNMAESYFYYSAIIGRSTLGILLILAAKQSKYPTAILIIGIITVLAAVIFIFIGHDNFQGFIANIMEFYRPYARIWALAAIAMGAFLVYAFMKQKE